MTYCNYTNFQHLFSKTYRENDGKDHTQFYWFGKLLKEAVNDHALFGLNPMGTGNTNYDGKWH